MSSRDDELECLFSQNSNVKKWKKVVFCGVVFLCNGIGAIIFPEIHLEPADRNPADAPSIKI